MKFLWQQIKEDWPVVSVLGAMIAVLMAAIIFNQINISRCEKVYGGPRLVVTATVGLKARCEITSEPYTRPIPSDEMIESATLGGGPAKTRTAEKKP